MRLAVLMVTSLAAVGLGFAPGSSGVAHAQLPGFDLCQFIPPELRPFIPECQGGGGGGEPGEVAATFSERGPWAVTSSTAQVPGTPGILLFHPTDLGANGYDHRIVTWGNGTIPEPNPCQLTEQAGGTFSHLASWGFVVTCANTGFAGSGQEMLAAARWLVDQDSNPGSVFFDNLDTENVAAVGGSQGATGAMNAMIQSNGLITSAYGWATIDPWVNNILGVPTPAFSQVHDPVFLASGTTDFLATQPQQQAYFDQIPGPAAKAAMVNVGHEGGGADIGYSTAWLKYTLEGDEFARSAFVATDGNPPELSVDPAWTNWQAKNLP